MKEAEVRIYCNSVTTHIINCASCQQIIQQFFSQRAGSTISERKSKASKTNGKLGGRPKKIGNQSCPHSTFLK